MRLEWPGRTLSCLELISACGGDKPCCSFPYGPLCLPCLSKATLILRASHVLGFFATPLQFLSRLEVLAWRVSKATLAWCGSSFSLPQDRLHPRGSHFGDNEPLLGLGVFFSGVVRKWNPDDMCFDSKTADSLALDAQSSPNSDPDPSRMHSGCCVAILRGPCPNSH